MHAGCSYFCSHIRKIITACILFQLYSYLIFWKYWLNCRQMKEREHCLGTHLSMFSILCRMETRPSERIVLRRCQLFFLFFGVIACISIVCLLLKFPLLYTNGLTWCVDILSSIRIYVLFFLQLYLSWYFWSKRLGNACIAFLGFFIGQSWLLESYEYYLKFEGYLDLKHLIV